MDSMTHCSNFFNSVLFISILATIFSHCDARFMFHMWNQKGSNHHVSQINKQKLTSHFVSNVDPYTINSPLYLPPFDSLSPLPQPGGSPFTPCPPPPTSSHSHGSSANPPSIFFSSPPQHQPTPPEHGLTPRPIYGPPTLSPPSSSVPPPKSSRSGGGVWCVAKPTVPDSTIQAAMDYACGSGGNCKAIQPNEPCFQPNTLISHASFAFNSYWLNTKGNGGTCDFGGTAMLVTVDPSFNKCKFGHA
ncbi:hypothetical protein ERO13_A07G084300v2 [Gossypium hirsutum]|uniref:Allergen Asp f 7 homolog n=1 Tax=Gossypium hirsutum TaxID=3635 RepID=A0A1U8MJ66_GOSHI|nr:allergen Asp f 7 homolog [Gossypium hirsutum]KAG4191284.1 hypothetical protein ERO13_A07G084300v2 [Gossypium hirsutum]